MAARGSTRGQTARMRPPEKVYLRVLLHGTVVTPVHGMYVYACVCAQITDFLAWLDAKLALQANKEPHEDPAFTSKEVSAGRVYICARVSVESMYLPHCALISSSDIQPMLIVTCILMAVLLWHSNGGSSCMLCVRVVYKYQPFVRYPVLLVLPGTWQGH